MSVSPIFHILTLFGGVLVKTIAVGVQPLNGGEFPHLRPAAPLAVCHAVHYRNPSPFPVKASMNVFAL